MFRLPYIEYTSIHLTVTVNKLTIIKITYSIEVNINYTKDIKINNQQLNKFKF